VPSLHTHTGTQNDHALRRQLERRADETSQ